MNCPIDGTELVITERSGVEIDYCPRCRGVWLDRGELDKIIDRLGPVQPVHPMPTYEERPRYDDRRRYDDDDYKHGYGKRKKREGFLGELFDFD